MDRYLIFIFFPIIFLSFPGFAVTAKLNKNSLPLAEQELANQVDHWGLSFSDQVRRFQKGITSQMDQLEEKSPKNFLVGIQHGLEKVPLNKYWFKGKYNTFVTIKAACNEYENFQVAVLPKIGKELSSVSLSKGDLLNEDKKHIISKDNMTIYRVVHAKTAQARYPAPYKGAWPDLLLPNAHISVKGTDLGLFWVEVKVPKNAFPGKYFGVLLLNGDGEKIEIQVKLKVFAFALPDRVPFPVAVWLRRDIGDGPMPVEEYRQLSEELLKHGIDPLNIVKDFVSVKDNNFDILDKNITFGLERGQQIFEIPASPKNPELLGPLVDYLRKKGWLKKSVIYSNRDEPDRKTFNNLNRPYYEKIHALYPDLRVFLASEYHPEIDKGCDIWLNDLSTGNGFEFAQKNVGTAELWAYYCHLPINIDYQRPLVHAPNMLIDNEAIEHRLAFWMAWKYKTKGIFIYSGGPKADWLESGWELSSKPYTFPYAGLHNGNGWLIYTGSHPSIRMKVLRDGLEDLGYLMLLEKISSQLPKKQLPPAVLELLSIPKEVLVTQHYFNRDPSALFRVREAMAMKIEALLGHKTR